MLLFGALLVGHIGRVWGLILHRHLPWPSVELTRNRAVSCATFLTFGSALAISKSVMAVTAASPVAAYGHRIRTEWERAMNTTTNNNRELTDAELLDVCGGTDNVLEAVAVRLEAVAKAASSAVSTILKAF